MKTHNSVLEKWQNTRNLKLLMTKFRKLTLASFLILFSTSAFSGDAENKIAAACIANFGATPAALKCAAAANVLKEVDNLLKGKGFGKGHEINRLGRRWGLWK